jgi:hypothetical protein
MLTCLSVLAVPGASRNGQTTNTVTITKTATITQWNATTVFNTATITQWNATTKWNTTTSSSTIVVSPSILWIFPVDQTNAGIVTAVVVGLIFLIFMLGGSALILRSRSSKALGEADGLRGLVRELQSQPERASSASSALKRLLESGVLQPKEYMEKKMIAERLERKMSAKQLLEEGLISKEQYDALVRKEEGQDLS